MTDHAQREIPADKERERQILTYLAPHLQCDFRQIMTAGKYKFDGWLVSGRTLVGLVECKWLSGTGFYGLNIAKYHQMTQLSARLAVPSYYACRTPGRMGYIKFHNGVWEDIEPTFTLAGGTPKGKEQNWDDIEPMAMFNERDINWIVGGEK